MPDAPVTRPSLLVRIRNARDEDAWRQFLELYTPLLYGFARRQRLQDADAADLAQEVLGEVSTAVRNFDYDPGKGSFRGWLFTLAHRKLCRFLDRLGRPGRASGDSGTRQILQEIPAREEELFNRDYEHCLFHWAAARVQADFSTTTWQAFWRTGVEGREPRQVAQELGISIGAVYIARSRVQARLKDIVQEAQLA